MKIAVIGGGASGVYSAIKIKECNPSYDVVIFEHNDKLVKKINATGNGKCNFANLGNLINKYSNEEFALKVLNEYPVASLLKDFDSYGIHYKNIDNLVYPMSESAETVSRLLIKQIEKLNIDVRLNQNIIDYQIIDNKVIINNETFDKVIFSTGGKSSPQLGSDGSLFSTFKRHGYNIVPFSPSLCPIVIKQNVKRLDGVRCKANVNLYNDNELIHSEIGEVLFKKDGLSGIAIFNMSHYINEIKNKKNVYLEIDFLPLVKENINEDKYDEYVNAKLADYLSYHHLDIHKVIFTYERMYDYIYSQVSKGGISIKDVDYNLKSKIEDNVYFIGEVIDVSAVCGGFNLMWAFASAYKVSRNI